MLKKYNLIIILLFSISFINNALSENNFFLEAKKNYDEKNIRIPNFYFKEILFLILIMKIHICI